MEILLVLIWFCLVWILPLTFVFTAWFSVEGGRKLRYVLPALVLAVIVYIPLSLSLIQPMFAGLFAGSETDPSGGGDLYGRLMFGLLDLGYAAFGWAACSAIAGRMIKPWSPFPSPIREIVNG